MQTLEEMEREAIEKALAECHGNRTHAAALLDTSVRNLQRKIKRYGLPPAPKGYHAQFRNSEKGRP